MDAGIAVLSGIVLLGIATEIAGLVNKDQKQLVTGVCLGIVGMVVLMLYISFGYQA